jgi:hypothetical protein
MDAEVEQRLGAVAAEEGWDESEVEAIRAYLSGVQPTAPMAPPTTLDGSDEGPWTAAPPPPVGERQGFELPGGDELDEALAALGEPVAPPPARETPAEPASADGGTSREWAKSHAEVEALASAPRPDVPWPGMEHEPRSMPPASEGADPTAASTASTADADSTAPALEPEPEWMRGRQDAAARAYRRLRRIFPNSER